MTYAQQKTTQNSTEQPEDRLSHALDFANKLNESRLWKIRVSYQKRWTRHRKTRQSVRIQTQKPWAFSTGPKTAEGKATSSMNARQGDLFDRTFFLPALQAQENFLRTMSLLLRFKRNGLPVPPGLQQQCLAMGKDATNRLLTALALSRTIFLPNSPENPVYLRPI